MADVKRTTRNVNEWAIPLSDDAMSLDDLIVVVREAEESSITQRRLAGQMAVSTEWRIQELGYQDHLVIRVTTEDVD